MRVKQTILIGVSFLLILGFQNCTQKFGIHEQGNSQVVVSSGNDPNYYDIDLSLRNTFPTIKMLFVVDNSASMLANQLNLVSSFSTLFSGENSTNLTPYNVKIFVISTAQASNLKLGPAQASLQIDPLSEAIAKKIPTEYLPFSPTSPVNVDTLSYHRGDLLSGAIAGDIIGYRVKRTISSVDGTLLQEFLPAPVLDISGSGNQLVGKTTIDKSAGQNGDVISKAFADRIALLDPNRNVGKGAIGSSGEFDEILDKESGLCAVARTLKNNKDFFNPGDITSIVIVSDENETRPDGAACVEAISTKLTPKHATVFNYSLNIAAQPEKCNFVFNTGYTYSYSWTHDIEECLIRDGVKISCHNKTVTTKPVFKVDYPSDLFGKLRPDANGECPAIITASLPKGSLGCSLKVDKDTKTVLNDPPLKSCTELAANLCSGSGGNFEHCVGTKIDAVAAYTKTDAATTFTERRYLTCKDTCAGLNNKCSANPTRTIDQFLASSFKNYVQDSCVVANHSLMDENWEDNQINYVTGNDGNLPAQDLATYTLAKSQELFDFNIPFVSVFVRQEGAPFFDSLGKGGSYGVEYNRFADLFGGQKESVLESSYSSALKDLSQSIKARVLRSVVIPDMTGNKKARRVWRRDSAGNFSEELSPSSFTSNGNVLTFNESLLLEYNDVFRVEYW